MTELHNWLVTHMASFLPASNHLSFISTSNLKLLIDRNVLKFVPGYIFRIQQLRNRDIVQDDL